MSGFDFRSGVHVGRVPAYTIVDVNLSYPTDYGIVYRLSIANALDNAHREFVTGPRIHRLVVAEVEFQP